MQSETCLPIWIYVMDWRGLCFRDFIGYLSEYGSASRWSILIVSIEYVSFWLDMFLVVVNVLHLFQTSSAWKSYLIIVDFVLKVLLSNKLKITKTFCLTFIWEGAEGIICNFIYTSRRDLSAVLSMFSFNRWLDWNQIHSGFCSKDVVSFINSFYKGSCAFILIATKSYWSDIWMVHRGQLVTILIHWTFEGLAVKLVQNYHKLWSEYTWFAYLHFHKK